MRINYILGLFFFSAVVFFNYPLISVFSRNNGFISGIPVFYLFLTGSSLAIVLILLVIDSIQQRGGDK